MQLEHLKATFAALWILVVLGIGFLTASTPLSWVLILALALLPPMLVAWRWRAPDQTLSQSIQEARR